MKITKVQWNSYFNHLKQASEIKKALDNRLFEVIVGIYESHDLELPEDFWFENAKYNEDGVSFDSGDTRYREIIGGSKIKPEWMFSEGWQNELRNQFLIKRIEGNKEEDQTDRRRKAYEELKKEFE